MASEAVPRGRERHEGTMCPVERASERSISSSSLYYIIYIYRVERQCMVDGGWGMGTVTVCAMSVSVSVSTSSVSMSLRCRVGVNVALGVGVGVGVGVDVRTNVRVRVNVEVNVNVASVSMSASMSVSMSTWGRCGTGDGARDDTLCSWDADGDVVDDM